MVLTGFLYDQDAVACFQGGVEGIINCTQKILAEIGLIAINPQKSVGIISDKGVLQSAMLSLENGHIIQTAQEKDECCKLIFIPLTYLSFADNP